MSEKSHQPTAKKLRDAKKKGQIPRSKLLTSAVVTFGGLVATLVFADDNARRIGAWTRQLLLEPQSPRGALEQGLRVFALGVTPTLVGSLLAALFISVATAGLQFNPDSISPKLERLDFVKGAEKLFSMRQVIDVLKNLAVAVFIGWLFFDAIESHAAAGIAAFHHGGASAFHALLTLLRSLLLRAAAFLVVLGVFDWGWARHRHIKDLMMSHDEVKQEHKNADGDPHQKAKRKSLHKQLASGGSARGVAKATAVIVNPTHIAVAIRYAEDECDAPYIVARGREEDALKIRREAESLSIPVVRDIPLARTLVHYDVGEEVPEELYQAAAAILKVALEVSAPQKDKSS